LSGIAGDNETAITNANAIKGRIFGYAAINCEMKLPLGIDYLQ
jgi:hypothetical protein